MGAALTIAVLFTVSSTIVRVAGVFLEHTGISRDIARLQAMSALSGTGFTTSEFELLLQTPERRRILMLLIATGAVGLASVVATVVVGAFGVKETVGGLLLQFSAIVCSGVFIRYVLFSQKVDNTVCGLANAWLSKRMVLTSYNVLYQFDENVVLAAHQLAALPPVDPAQWSASDLAIVGLRDGPGARMRAWDHEAISAGTEVVLAGPVQSHMEFSAAYGARMRTGGH